MGLTMNPIWVLVLVLVVVAIVGIKSLFYDPSRAYKRVDGVWLPKRFADLAPLKGRTKAEILSAVGQPTSTTIQGEGQLLLQWITQEHDIALLFHGDTCEGVTHVGFRY